jgi:two-component system OmpR family sensor kinase
MAVLLTFFSLILSTYINYGVETSLRSSMIKQANYLFAKYPDLEKALREQHNLLRRTLKINARIERVPDASYAPRHFRQIVQAGRTYLEGYFPFNFQQQRYLVLTKDITLQKHLQKQVFHAIIFLNILAMGLIILYAFFLSKMLLAPIRFFSQKLEKMNENILEPLDLEKIPLEFRPLGESINQLVTKIKSFLLYKKELFVGTAHELKTPLAVIKTRSQVALMKKKKTPEDLERVIKENIATVDDMNRIISAILEFGRAEGAQFERPVELDLMEFLRKKADEYSLLAEASGKHLRYRLTPPKLRVRIQPLLLTQILQNLIQNALRFTPKGGTVRLFSYLKDDRLILKIRDEGPGIDESADLFAPFKRSGDSPGAGLGLFLVKSAADAMGAEVTLKNRRDGRGTVATLILPLKNLRP